MQAAAAVEGNAAQAADGLDQPARQRAMLVIILGIMVAVLDGTIVNLALPGIARELQASPSHAIWVVNAYQIATLVMLLPLASLGDLVGYRRVYLVGMAVFTVSSIGATFADSLATLIAARTFQGLGAAGIMSVNAALVRLTFPSALLGRGMAINSMVVATSAVAGPSVAAAILSVASWPWLFAINVPLGAITLALGLKALPFNRVAPAAGLRFSPIDVALNVLMFSLVFLGVDRLGVREGGVPGGAQASAWAILLAGVAVGFVYLRRQRRLAVPLFPIDLLRIPVFALSMGTSVAAFCAQMLAYIALPFLLLEVYGRSHIEAGLLITAWPLAIVAMAPIAGRLIGRYPDGLLGGIGLGLLAIGLALLAALPAHPGNADIAWRMALCGLGFGLFQSPNNHTIVTSPPAHRSGAASGMLGTARLTGQTLGAVVLAGVFSIWTPHGGRGPVVALVLAACCAGLAAVFSSLRLKTTGQGG
ncbi:DHA2 family multidrug resistance protein-like MFS transporter [Variovorax paradoxus]|uniref:DHA2 family multidrug resistance protein-like MFS transporter n=1 Tax=Variovorax paradoxus TaxID=34073 RepID=A0AAW8ECL2_VARPD|nr:MFS transporter [Variovorax paradoxus]MDP9969847.1 DHA2 family multidrug resistance protein-like MFS transporter [Variovorax paradoxus]